mmetsp:Transcript_66086/g.154731  ORF Transcript_66086/g.154731 Transcript_66086/m.154731 type:complete len:212 (-) Transcript_66086:510-1145(-)
MLALHRQGTSTFLFPDLIQDCAHNLVSNVGHMSATTRGVDGIHEAHLLKARAICQANRNFPAIIYHLARAEHLGLHMKIHVVLKAGDAQALSVQEDLTPSLRGSSEVESTTSHQCNNVLLEIAHSKAGEVRKEGDLSVVLRLILNNAWFVANGHVLLPDLLVLLAAPRVCCLQHELCRKNVGQLGAIAITSTDNLFLTVVIVVACEQMTEN